MTDIKGYNGLVIKDIWHPGDSSKRPKPDRIIIGVGDGTAKKPPIKSKITERIFPETPTDTRLPRVPEGWIDAHRPAWHNWVYGGESHDYDYDKVKWKQLSIEVFKRDRRKCISCGTRKELTVHHIKPRNQGGTDDMRNLTTLCIKCHDRIEVEISESLLGGGPPA
jgi:hypothetical protein